MPETRGPETKTSESQSAATGDTAGQCFRFDLQAELASVRQDAAFQQGPGRLQKMLVKGPGLRIALTVMKSGNQWTEHKTPSRIFVQPISGSIRFVWPDGEARLGAGQFLALDPGIPHSVEALEDAAFLLTLC